MSTRSGRRAAASGDLTDYYPRTRRATAKAASALVSKALRPPSVPAQATKADAPPAGAKAAGKRTLLIEPQALIQPPSTSTPEQRQVSCSPRKRKTPTPPHAVCDKRPTVTTARRQLVLDDGRSASTDNGGGTAVVVESQNDKATDASSRLPPLPPAGKAVPAGPKCVRNLAALRAQLAQCSAAAQRLNDIEGRRQERELALHKAHISPVKAKQQQLHASPDKADDDDKPAARPLAYRRYADLAEDTSAKLGLPLKHQLLHDFFRSTDTVVAMMHARKELCTFDKVKPAVQTMTKRTFTMRHVGQFKSVYPESYTYCVQKRHQRFGAGRTQRTEWDFAITPCFDHDLLNYKLPTKQKDSPCDPGSPPGTMRLTPASPRKTPCKSRVFLSSPMKVARPSPRKQLFDDGDNEPADTDGDRLTGARQVYRAAIFRQRLVDFVKKCHAAFLQTLSPPVSLDAGGPLRRWHPKFDLDKYVADVPVAELPQTPDELSKCAPATARDLLQATGAGKALPKRLSDALADVNDNETAACAPVEKVDKPAKATDKLSASLKNLPPALLAKIRAKQAASDLAEMSRDADAELRKLRLSRLPDFVRILRALYLSENKGSLPIALVAKKLAESYGSMISPDELDKHIDLLIELLPKWINKQNVGTAVYVRIKKEAAVNGLHKVIQDAK